MPRVNTAPPDEDIERLLHGGAGPGFGVRPPTGTPDAMLDVPTVDIFDTERGKRFQVPEAFTPMETDHALLTSADGQPRDAFVGALGPLDAMAESGKGLANFFSTAIVQTPELGMLEIQERRLQELEEPLNAGDILDAINPLGGIGDRAGAQDKIFARLTGGDVTDEIAETKQLIAKSNLALERNKEWLRSIQFAAPIAGPEGGEFLGIDALTFFDIGGGFGSVATSIGLGYLTRNPALVGTVFGLMQKSSIYEEARAAGKDAKTAGQLGTLAGTFEAALEGLGISLILKSVKIANPLARVTARVANEAVQEASQQTSEEVITQASGIRKLDVEAGLGRVAYAAAIGAIVSAPVNVVVQIAEDTAKQEGVDPGTARILGELMADPEVKAQLHAGLGEVIDSIESDKVAPPETREKVVEIIQKFLKGEDINLQEVLDKAPPDTASELARVIEAASEKADTELKIREARRTDIEREIGEVQTEVDKLEAEKALAENEGRKTKRLTDKIAAAEERKLKLEQELFPAQKAGLLPEHETKVESEKRITQKAKDLEKLGLDATKDRVKDINKAFKAGEKAARAEAKNAQSILKKLIEKSLPISERGRFNTEIVGIKSVEQLEKKLPKIRERILKNIERRRKTKVKNTLKKVLKATRAKRVAPGGRFGTPAIQSALDRLRDAFFIPAVETLDEAGEVRLDKAGKPIRSAKKAAEDVLISKEEAEARIEASLDGHDLTDIEIMENQILSVIAGRDFNADRMEDLLLSVNELIEGGREISKNNIIAKVVEQEETRQGFLGALGPQKRRTKVKDFIQATKTRLFQAYSGTWWTKLKGVMKSSDRALVDQLIDKVSLFKPSRVYEINKMKMVDRVEELMMESGHFKSRRALLSRLLKDRTLEVNFDGRSFTHSAKGEEVGESKQLLNSQGRSFTKAELRKRVMELENEDVRRLAMDPDSNGYTEDIITAMKSELDEVDNALIKAQLKFYAEYFERINEAHEKAFGVSLDPVEFYSPIRRQHAGEEAIETFLTGVQQMGGLTPKSFKKRVESVRELRSGSDFDVLQAHILEMEYFIAYNEQVRFITGVFKGDNAKLLSEIEKRAGKLMADTIKRDLDWFANKGTQISLTGEQAMTSLLRNFAFAQLGAKPQIGLKQLASFPAFAEDVNTKDFIAGVLKFLASPKSRKEGLELLNDSDFFRNRGINIDQDFLDLVSDKSAVNFLGKFPTITKILMLPIRYGDKGAIAIGGFGHYHAMRKKGKSHQEALKSFERIASRTQQSPDPDQQSEIQRSGSAFIRVMGQFMSSANALTRAEYSALADFKTKRINRKEFVKRMIIYHVLIPNLIQYIANGFNWDEEDQWRAGLLGTMNGILVFGEVIEAAVTLAYNAATGSEEDLFRIETRHPAGFAADLIKGMFEFAEEDITFEDFIEGTRAIDAASRGLAGLTGVPVPTLFNQLRGLDKALTKNEVGEGFQMLLGYSPGTVEKTEGGFFTRIED